MQRKKKEEGKKLSHVTQKKNVKKLQKNGQVTVDNSLMGGVF